MKDRILDLCSALSGPRLADILRMFAEREADTVMALLAEMVASGELRLKEARYYAP